MSEVVYFLTGNNGLCKIGRTENLPVRIVALERETKLTLILHHTVETNDAPWLEAKFHRYFQAERVYGEWFALSEEWHDRLVIAGRDFDSALCNGPLTIPAKVLGSKGGKNGGPARSQSLPPERRKEIARLGGLALQAKKRSSSRTDC